MNHLRGGSYAETLRVNGNITCTGSVRITNYKPYIITLEDNSAVLYGSTREQIQVTSGWTHGSTYVGMYKDPYGLVHLHGQLTNPSVQIPLTAIPLFTLPLGYRPNREIQFPSVYSPTIGVPPSRNAKIRVRDNGEVAMIIPDNAAVSGGISLSGVSFPAIN